MVDARGMLCPWPVLRLSRAARAAGGQGRILVLADDPAAARELARLCAGGGWRFAPDPEDNARFEVEIG